MSTEPLTVRKRAAIRQLLDATRRQWQETAQEQQLVAPFSPTPLGLVHSTLEQLRLTTDDVVVDLGCGDGRWLVEAAAVAGCRAVGVDMNDEALRRAKHAAEQRGVAALCRFERCGILEADCTRATVVVVYWFRDACAQLSERLLTSVPPTCRIVSVQFRFPGWAPALVVRHERMAAHVYVAAEQLGSVASPHAARGE